MEIIPTMLNNTIYYDVYTYDYNYSKKNNYTPTECDEIVNEAGLFDFIIYGVFVNLIGLFGIIGNILSMIILSRPQMKSSINYLLIGLARCDTVLIIIAMLIYGLPSIYAYTGALFNYRYIVYPKIVTYLYPVSCIAQMVTVYLTLAVTIERYIAVCHPLKARSFCTYGRARLAVFSIVTFASIYNLPKFWEIDFYTDTHWKYNITIYCVRATPLRNSKAYITFYVNWMYFCFYYILPFLALVIFNGAIYQRVRKANKDLQQLSRHQRSEIGLAMMLLCVVIVFIICNILPLASNIFETFIGDPPLWLVQLGNLLVTINSSINFIIYVIFGRKFKRIFLRLFCCSGLLFGAGKDSPEFQTHDDYSHTGSTHIDLRNSVRHSHLSRSNTISRNNNVPTPNGDNARCNNVKSPPSNVADRTSYYPRKINNGRLEWSKSNEDNDDDEDDGCVSGGGGALVINSSKL